MTFILLEHAPARLRGILTRWMIEPHP
ncbi:MAG: type I-E CRISPR-associated endoribonuclease Cas2, partial [Roseiflexaceae bacterium]